MASYAWNRSRPNLYPLDGQIYEMEIGLGSINHTTVSIDRVLLSTHLRALTECYCIHNPD